MSNFEVYFVNKTFLIKMTSFKNKITAFEKVNFTFSV